MALNKNVTLGTRAVLRWLLKKSYDGVWGGSWWDRAVSGSAGVGGGSHPGSKVNYSTQVGTGLGSSVLMSPVRWMQRTLPEAPCRSARLE